MWFRSLGRIGTGAGRFLAYLLAAGAMVFASGDSPVRAQNAAPTVLDAASVVQQLADSVAAGRGATVDKLMGLGFDEAVREIVSVDGKPINAFSSRTVIETLYRRAELAVPGDGDRLLAAIYDKRLKPASASLAIAPEFEFARKMDARRLTEPFKFAPLAALGDMAARPALSPVAEGAVNLMADHFSGPHLAQAKALVLRNLRKPGFDANVFERTLARSGNAREAWLGLIDAGTPPPRVEQALRSMLREAAQRSAIVATDRAVLDIMDELSRVLPPEAQGYAVAEDTIPSRQAQAREAAKADKPAKVARLSSEAEKALIIGIIGRQPPPPTGMQSQPPGPDGPLSPSGSSAARGPVGESYERYASQTFNGSPSGGGGGGGGVPRSFKVARVMPGAARGVAIGADIADETRMKPLKATWMPNAEDARFGRLFVEFAPANGRPVVAASRVMFADSFYAATSALWDKHGREAAFHDGNMLIVMSMDPSRDLAPEESRKLQAQGADLQLEYLRALLTDNKARLEEIERRVETLERSANALPRAIVLHPALTGRELAWSAARVDFWFNRMKDLSAESALVNGGKPMPANLLNINMQEAGTWQFYERDCAIRLGDAEGRARRLIVKSRQADTEGLRSHFSVSMFAFADEAPPRSERVEDGTYRLPGLEHDLQPMLDWLATNHPDFMRLNDFSESFSILRWLREQGAPVRLVNLTGQPPAIATPDRVVIGQGPRVAPK